MKRQFFHEDPHSVVAARALLLPCRMLRITTHEDGSTTRVRIEGRVTGDTMEELRSICETRLGESAGLVLDVGGIAYADANGATLLRTLETRGASVVGANGFLAELMRRTGVDPEPPRTRESAQPLDDEQALVERMRAGDDLAYELVVRRFAPRLLSVARRMLDSQEEAEDALQEAFLSAFRGIHSFSGDARLSTWLHRIVVNAALMRLRSRRRRSEESIEDLLPHFGDDGQWLEAPSSWHSDELFDRKQARAVVRRAIEALPMSHREVLTLRDIEELDTAEVADMLGISANAVKVRLHRARQALRALIARELAQA